MFAQIIIPLALPVTYTWKVPEHLQGAIKPGVRVEVELRNKKYAGIVKSITLEKPEAFEPKEILTILDEEPIVYEKQLQLWQWVAGYYMCSEGEVMQAAVPANLKLNSESILIWNEEYGTDFTHLSNDEFVVAEALEIAKELRFSEVQQILESSPHVYAVIKKLIDKGVCFIWEELKTKYKPRTENYITLHPQYHDEEKLEELLNNFSKAPKQLELLLAYLHLYKTEGEVTQSSLLKKSGATAAQLKGLIGKNILIAEKKAIDRIKAHPCNIEIGFELSPAQQSALSGVENSFKEKNVCLLHGVTSSGKTQIYIKLIESLIRQGKQVLYMLPEIALTAQIIRRLQKHFGGYIGIYHSKFNANERVEIWNKVKNGELKVVLGARSSLFLPFQDLGLIIADEEHDASYKQQEPAPRYHARDAAIYYANLFNAKVLLGSATPSVETYFNCTTNKYGLVELNERYGNIELPEIEMIDLKKIDIPRKNKLAISLQLKFAIHQSLQNQKQVIIFQNKRGYSPYIICSACGWIPHCQHCDVTLTYHKARNQLTCHYCGTNYPVINTCAACGSHSFKEKNFGTEKLEEILAEEFPDAKIARMDYDSVKGKNAHDNLIKLFEQQRINILVGTQMVVKGLDFDHVNLVGIVDADAILNFTDFRVNERAYQLMEQVSGRAGRKNEKGKVMIQVHNTHHPVLQFVKEHNYSKMFEFELQSRKAYNYPPFYRLIVVSFKHQEGHLAEEAAHIMVQGLRTNYSQYVHGPAQPVVERVRNQYIWEVMLKLPKDSTFIQQCKKEIEQQIAIIHNNKNYRSVTILPDVDPM